MAPLNINTSMQVSGTEIEDIAGKQKRNEVRKGDIKLMKQSKEF